MFRSDRLPDRTTGRPHGGTCQTGISGKPGLRQASSEIEMPPGSAAPRKRAGNTRAQTPALLKGLLFGPDGTAMSPTHTRKKGKLYRYYISQSVMKRGREACLARNGPF
jgi:hypothetical protein